MDIRFRNLFEILGRGVVLLESEIAPVAGQSPGYAVLVFLQRLPQFPHADGYSPPVRAGVPQVVLPQSHRVVRAHLMYPARR